MHMQKRPVVNEKHQSRELLELNDECKTIFKTISN